MFRDVTFPVLKPILLILTSLSIIWDFGVFTQPYLLIGASHVDASNYLMGVYVYIEGYAHSDFGTGAAISILMLLIVAALSVVYVRRDGADGGRHMSSVPVPARPRRGARAQLVRRRAWDALGVALFVVLVFPVYSMVTTAFKPDDEINGVTPTWFPSSPTLDHFREAMARPYFWDTVRNSVIVVVVAVLASMVIAFASQRWRSRSTASRDASSSSSP